MSLKKWLLAFALCALCSVIGAGQAMAELKIGIMNPERVVGQSEAGKKAKVKFEARVKDLQGKFKGEQEQVVALQQEIEKKSSAWSETKKGEKVRELQKLRRELQTKTEDANFELKQLQEKELQPILKALEEVVTNYAKKNAYSIILRANPNGTVIYFEKAVDISDDLISDLNKAMK